MLSFLITRKKDNSIYVIYLTIILNNILHVFLKRDWKSLNPPKENKTYFLLTTVADFC